MLSVLQVYEILISFATRNRNVDIPRKERTLLAVCDSMWWHTIGCIRDLQVGLFSGSSMLSCRLVGFR